MYEKYCMEDDEMMLPSPIVLGGSEVMSGEGKMIVLCVGKSSRIGDFVYEVHRTAVERRCEVEKMFEKISFEISKYLMLGLMVMSLFYWCKTIVFLIIQNKFLNGNWGENWLDFGMGLSVILEGIPFFQVYGLTMGVYYLKILIFREDGILFKYAKDCGRMKEISCILF
jgi:magnesium-transporting ATPase (P-type)